MGFWCHEVNWNLSKIGTFFRFYFFFSWARLAQNTFVKRLVTYVETSPYYHRVFNLDWEKVLSFYSQILYLNDLELIFSRMHATLQLTLSFCPSVCPSVRRLVGRSVRHASFFFNVLRLFKSFKVILGY